MSDLTDGYDGHRIFTGSQPVATEKFNVIKALGDCVLSFDSLSNKSTQNVRKGDLSSSGVPLKRGDQIYGRFTNVVSDALVMCYLV